MIIPELIGMPDRMRFATIAKPATPPVSAAASPSPIVDTPNVAAPAANVAASSTTSNYSVIYAFGDSLSDAGNDYLRSGGAQPVTPPYSDGRFTNGNTWVQDLAADLNLPAVTPSLSGGTDYANGGAYAGQEPLHNVGNTDLPTQLAQFEANVPDPSPTALYTLNIGGNDLRSSFGDYLSNPAGVIANVQATVSDELSFVSSLAAFGARNFIVLDTPDLGKTPSYSGPNTTFESELVSLYNQELSAGLKSLAASDGLNVQLIDIFTLLDDAIAQPRAFRFTNVTDPVWTGTFNSASSGTLNATGAAQNNYLFFDSLHPTAAGHVEIANLALASLGINR